MRFQCNSLGSNIELDVICAYSAGGYDFRIFEQNSRIMSFMASNDDFISPFMVVLMPKYFKDLLFGRWRIFSESSWGLIRI